MASNPTAFGVTVTKSAGLSTSLTLLFSYSDADNDIVAFAVKDREFGGGYLTRDGVQQAETALFDNIPISEISRWALVAGPAGTTSTIGFNAIDSRGAFNPSAVATVNVPIAAAHNPTASGVTVTMSAGQSTPLSSLFSYSDADNDIVAFAVRDREFGGGYLTKDGIPQTETALFDFISINELFRWAFVAGPAGSTPSTIGFNAIDSRGAYSPSATATVNTAAATDDFADEASDGTAPIGAVSVGGSTAGFIGPADANDTFGDKDVFRVFLTQGQTYQIRMQSAVVNGQALQSGLFTVRDPNNFDAQLAASTEGSNVTVSFTATATGDHYIRTGSGGLTPGQGGYQVSVTNTTPADDFTNTTGTAGTIAVGGTATGAIETVNDTDWFKATLVAGRTYRFDLEGSATGQGTLVDPYMSVRDSAGVKRVESDNGGVGLNSSFAYTAAVSGTHYLATGAGFNPNGVGTYLMRLTDITAPDDFADEAADATSPIGTVSVGGSATGFIGPADANDTFGDKDVFRIFLTQGQTYQIRMQSAVVNGQALATGLFTVRDPGNFDVVLATSTEGSNVTVSFTAAATGDHYIRTGSGGVTPGQGGYQVSVTNTTPTLADDFRDNLSDSTAALGAVSVGGSVTGVILPGPNDESGDKDWFKVTLTQGRVYEISLVGEGVGGQAALTDPYFTVRNSAGDRLTGLNTSAYDTYDDAGLGDNALVEFGANQTNTTYYIVAGAGGDDFSAAHGGYRLQVTDVTATEPGATFAAAKLLSLPSGHATQSGFVGFGGDSADIFKIVAPSDGALTLELTGLLANLDVQLRDASGQVLGSSAQLGSQQEQITADVRAGQEVYAEIRSPLAGQGSPYTLDAGLTASPPPGSGGLQDAATLFGGKKLLTMADFALAAYDVQTWEPDSPRTNGEKPGAEWAKGNLLTSGWQPLDLQGILPAPASATSTSFQTGFQNGFYASENAAAFVARSADALVLSFRGTNDNSPFLDTNLFDPLSPDMKSWFAADVYYNQLQPVIDAVDTFVGKLSNGITQVLVTGHSLGAAMVDYFMSRHGLDWQRDDHTVVSFEGYDFARPDFVSSGSSSGSSSGILNAALNAVRTSISNPTGFATTFVSNAFDLVVDRVPDYVIQDRVVGFHTGADILRAANVPGKGLTPGVQNVLSPGILNPIEAHSMGLYRELVASLPEDALLATGDSFIATTKASSSPHGFTVGDDHSGTNGNDVFGGGAGSDTYRISLGGGKDVIWDTDGPGDRIILTGTSVGRHFDVAGNDLIVVVQQYGKDIEQTIRIKDHFASDQKHRIETLTVGTLTETLPKTPKDIPGLSDIGFTVPIVTESAGSTPAILYKGTASPSDTFSVASQTINSLIDLAAGVGTLFNFSGLTPALAGPSTLAAAPGSPGDFNFSLTGFENVYGGAGDDQLTGDGKANILKGGAGRDTVDGGGGNDTLVGGSGEGDDTYIGGEGIDTVSYTSATQGISVDLFFGHYAQGPEIGTDALSGIENVIGGDGDDSIAGDDGTNVLEGGRGADFLYGYIGNDALFGGVGDDHLEGDEGQDTLNGDDGDDLLLGDLIDGEGFSDILRGGAGRDFLIGGLGNDALDGGVGVDDWAVYDYALSAVTVDLATGRSTGGDGLDTLIGLEHVSGSDFDDILRGNAVRNVLVGNGGNDRLEGQGGDDILRGSAGDDVLVGGIGSDTASYFDAGAGVVVSLLITVGQDTGDAGVDILSGIENLNGSEFSDTLIGNAGNNVLDGLGDADVMIGGLGSDTYVVDDAGDMVTELAGQGTDKVRSFIGFDLSIAGANVENLDLVGTGNIDGIGNALANTIIGNSGANVLDGGIDATASIVDQLKGGLGDDTYIVRNANDKVTELTNQGSDTVKSFITYVLGLNLENLELQGSATVNGTGNTLNNRLTGNSGNNILNGAAGADAMQGGDGNDIYFVDNIGDTVTETNSDFVTGGNDLVNSSVSFVLGDHFERLVLTGALAINGTGNALANTIAGNGGANIIEGGALGDILSGGAGIDTLSYASSSLGVNVTLRDGTLAALASGGDSDGDVATGFENLIGATQADTLIGNSVANILDGRVGADAMTGGLGNDTYVVDDAGDTVTELLAQGSDKVQSFITFNLGISGANVENLDLLGTDDIDGTGNELANTIIGNSGANILDGGIDATASIVDQLKGGLGDDTYIVRNAKDVATEFANQGTDMVRSFITYTLGAALENLDLQGTSGINGTGNSLANAITGNTGNNVLNGMAGNDTLDGAAGADTLIGGLGNDRLTGGAGADLIVFNTSLNAATNLDAITDFVVGDDTIQLENAIFTKLTVLGTLSAAAFVTGTAAADASDRIIFDSNTGKLYYDADGTDALAQVQFATLDSGLALTATDFLII